MAVRHLLFDMTADGKTVVMSTHLLHEADGTADQIVMMDGGTAWESGSIEELARRHFRGIRVHLDALDRDLLAMAEGHPSVKEFTQQGHVTLTLDSIEHLPDLVSALVAEGARLTRVEPDTPTLERLYFQMRAGLEEER
jgi:ABC-2 type transport system ATP-binding protein